MNKEIPVITEKESFQFNSQDLDQEQNANLNPVQLNMQNVHVHVTAEKTDYSGRITGITYFGRNREIVKDATILLFFGHETVVPVYKTRSDADGNFVIEELPPGYYTIKAKYGEYQVKTQFIKVLPGQNVYQALHL
ncbi:MAG: carboxypeptidase regulatory-like domain-containing protein [Clostridiaceae bacterium]|jgi:hypothetical protein|nr:carboxypeptidase regulatory-like domain-containing protein [Clostridiaceae bacterium]